MHLEEAPYLHEKANFSKEYRKTILGGLYMNNKKYTVSGTNIEDVKRQNEQSGLTYNEAKRVLANKFNSNKK